MSEWSSRAAAFCARFGIEVPILQAPMAGACPPSLPIAVMEAGGSVPPGCCSWRPRRSWPGPSPRAAWSGRGGKATAPCWAGPWGKAGLASGA